MTSIVKFDRAAANQYYNAPQDAAFSFPAPPGPPAEWAVGFILSIDGSMTGDVPQTILSTGPTATTGAFNVILNGDATGTSSNFNRIAIWLNTLGNASIHSSSKMLPGEKALWVIQHTGTTLTLRRCPILAQNPTDGSAVTAEGSTTRNAALTGPAGMYIGARSNLVANRMCDQSIGRVFRIDGTLTDLEMAKLAYGMEITELGKAPLFYLPLESPTDFVNEGSSAVTFTKSGSQTAGSDIPFGYTGAPAATAPTITGTPTISGTPQVGSSIGYTPASASGEPTPTRTQQWTIDGVDIAGATAATYTPVSGDAGKALRVRQIETNTISPAATATSAPVTVTAVAASDALTAVPMVAESVHQQIGGSKTFSVSGTYTGAVPASIQYRIVNEDGTEKKPWTTLTGATISGGSWSGSMLASTSNMTRVEYRSRTSGGATLAGTGILPELFAVGDLLPFLGSSSAANAFDSGSVGQAPSPNIRKYSGSAWSKFGTLGYAIRVGNALAARAGYAIGLLDCGAGSTTLQTWVTTASNYKVAIANTGGKLAGAIISVGSNDTTGEITSTESHLAKMNQLRDIVRNEVTLQPDLPIFWSGMNGRSSSGTLDASCNFLRSAEKLFGEQANCYHLQTLDLESSTDKIHLTSAGYVVQADRMGLVVGEGLYGGGVKKRMTIASASYSGANLDITITHANGTDFALPSSLPLFAVTDASGSPVAVSASKLSPSRLRVTYDRALVGPVSFTYATGRHPDRLGMIVDNGTVPLSLTAQPLSATATLDNASPSYFTVSQTMGFSYTVEAATVTPTPQYYTVSQTLGFAYAVAAATGGVLDFTPSAARTVTVHPDSKAFTAGSFWKMDNPKKPVGLKDPNSVIDITFDWGPWLDDIGNPAIATATFGSSSSLTRGTVVTDVSKVSVMVSGGTTGDLELTSTITTATNPARTEERTVVLRIEER